MFISGEWLFENQIMNLKILFNVNNNFLSVLLNENHRPSIPSLQKY